MLNNFARCTIVLTAIFWIAIVAKASTFPTFDGIENETVRFPYVDKSVDKEIILNSRLFKPNSPAPWNLVV